MHIQDPELRSATVQTSINIWVSNDREAVSEWLSEMEPSEMRDEAISSFSHTLGNDPKAAMIWANQIQNKEMRLNAMEKPLR